MKPQRARLLAELLREMREQDGNYFPEEVWLEIHKTVSLPYVELLIPRKVNDKWEFFLTRRASTDPDWPSTWHVPGGLWRTNQTQREACESVALREVGIPLEDIHEVMTYKWTTHPRGNVISHVCLCRATNMAEAKPDAGFFVELPAPFIEEEIQFIEKCRSYLGEA